jgi:hypothetical protein
MIEHQIRPRTWRDRLRRRPLVVAVFAFRYDAHLVPDLIANLSPAVDGWISWDDRARTEPMSSDADRRRVLIGAARDLGADWVLAADPDERFDDRLARRMRRMTRRRERILWSFRLREMYAPDRYRIDGLWGRKQQLRLFPLLDGQIFSDLPFHGPWTPIEGGYERRHADIDIYHLKMIAPERRRARRDLYRALDPERRYQPTGYDYLGEEEGAVFETIRPGRGYHPAHVDDGGLWMPLSARAGP